MPEIKSASKFDSTDTEILFEPFPKQIEFLESVLSGEFSFILFGGAIRSGKTFCGLASLIILAMLYPGSRWAVIRKDLQILKKNTLPSWDKLKPTKWIKKHNHETQVVTFKNGSQILFFGINEEKDRDFNRLRGMEINGAFIDEINEISEPAYFKVLERCGSHILKDAKQPKPLIIASCNPSFGWIKERFYNPWRDGKLPPNQKFIPSTIFQNPYVPPDYLESLKSLPKFHYMVFVQGSWDVAIQTGMEFYKEFDLDRHIGKAKFDPNKPVHISLDENVHPYISLGIFQIAEKKIFQVGEILGRPPNNTIIKSARLLNKWLLERDFDDIIFIYGDSTSRHEDTRTEKGVNAFTLLERTIAEKFHYRSRVPKINPSVSMSNAFMNAIFEKNFGDLSILIDENECKESIQDYLTTLENADGGVLKIKTKNDEGISMELNGHLCDMFRYFVVRAFEDDYRKFQTKMAGFPRVIGSPSTKGRRR